MSEFFRALERAERERALRRPNTSDTAGDHAAPAAAVPATPAAESATMVAEPVAATVMTPEAPVEPIATAAVVDPPVVEAPVPLTPAAADVHPQLTTPPAADTTPSRPLTGLLGRGRAGTGEVDEHLVSLITPDTFEADQYRVLRHTVEQRRRTAGLAIVAVTSAGPGDGKTTTAINLAGALAQDRGARVLLVDCDLRSSAMARRLGLAEGRGLVQAIVDPMLTLDDAIRHLPRFNLDVMAAGFETASPYELLKSPRLGDLFESARRRYDYVVVDTPPATPFPDCRVLAKIVDGFLLVVSAHRTPRRLVDEAVSVLPGDAVIGVVFNSEDRSVSRGYDGYYGETPARTWRRSARKAWLRAWRESDSDGDGDERSGARAS